MSRHIIRRMRPEFVFAFWAAKIVGLAAVFVPRCRCLRGHFHSAYRAGLQRSCLQISGGRVSLRRPAKRLLWHIFLRIRLEGLQTVLAAEEVCPPIVLV